MVSKTFRSGKSRIRFEFVQACYPDSGDLSLLNILFINGERLTLSKFDNFLEEYDAWCDDPNTALEKYENIAVQAMSIADKLSK
jgi:hypothetical protein